MGERSGEGVPECRTAQHVVLETDPRRSPLGRTPSPAPVPTVGCVNETPQFVDGTRRKQSDAEYVRDGRHPEARTTSGVLSGLRRDLFSHPFAARPLPPLDGDRVAGRVPWLSPRQGRYLRWFPHALVLGYAFVLLMFAVQTTTVGPPLIMLIFGVLVAGPPAMTLIRPVGAFWLSLLAACFGMLGGGGGGAWMLSFLGHVATMVLVVLRTRPRLATEMWAVTFVLLTPGITVLGTDGSLLPQAAVLSGIVLMAAAAVRAWREERQQVEETRTVTAEERSRRTTLEERATIARELHDVVAHHMSVIAIQAEAAPYRVRDTPPELATAFSTIRENAVAALTELRRILGVVRSEDPDAFAGPEAPQPTLADLDALLESVRGAGLTVTAVVTGAVRPLPQGVELSAYRIIQEALSNTLRHAPGAEARVEVAYVLGGLGLRVVNGPPNRLAKPSPGAGHGVLGMHERVGMLNGDMTNGPTPDGGYEVTVFLPAARDPEPSRPSAAESSGMSVPESSGMSVPESPRTAVPEPSRTSAAESVRPSAPEPPGMSVPEPPRMSVSEPSRPSAPESPRVTGPQASASAAHTMEPTSAPATRPMGQPAGTQHAAARPPAGQQPTVSLQKPDTPPGRPQ